ncbi:hypothetical protein [Pseudoalteromonas luteoviolacea]|uniref:Uncharacterized protein n=1 Tax=Pseudoalteromonas luteoviolacea (strain 2ta16) TaxID=1353533 RepID=V4HP20_PSEL2|nr:hypothetical protein [Pseudoalteromonas luteoviolacea]ESP91518.1 hypothetical protein PL2TA16_00317 [Pseudoalteromonas luteoviolacea 2ta16]KZN40168.1 hypothetical protein N483_18435 [Pseudoalteromonas luteoviolacea NCIMB 1944]
MDKYEKWRLTKAEIMAAYALLPEDVIESGNGYCEKGFLTYISHNELLLAMEELGGVIVDNGLQSKQFWTHLINAAKLMNHRHVDRYSSIRSEAT